MATLERRRYNQSVLNASYVLVAILALAVLMVVHEGGHMLVARAFSMRVIRFSIGFGPTIWKHQPKDSPTTYQVAIIPFLAYVQIAGMNPFEENDPDDRGSYANAGLFARIATIFAGPLANLLFAFLLFFASLMMRGKPILGTSVEVQQDEAAASAGMQSGDQIVEIEGQPVRNWEELREGVLPRGGKETQVVVLRNGERVKLTVVPRSKDDPSTGESRGFIGVKMMIEGYEPRTVGEAAQQAVMLPIEQVQMFFVGISRMIRGTEQPNVAGPIGIVAHTAQAASLGADIYLRFVGHISTALAMFNLLPLPALDGGRLMFLLYEAVTRRRPDARVEANIHIVGFVLLFGLFLVVAYNDAVQHLISKF